MAFLVKNIHKNNRKSTIVIEQEDSLLAQSQIKDFLQTEQPAIDRSLITSSKNQQNLQSPASLSRSNSSKQYLTSQGFFRSNSLPRNNSNLINSNRLTLISQIEIKPNNTYYGSFAQGQKKNFTHQTKKSLSNLNRSNSMKKLNTSASVRKLQIESLLQNKKLWSQKLLINSKKLQPCSNLQINEEKLLTPNNKRSFSVKNIQNPIKENLKDSLRKDFIRNISNSTWMKLNPETKKESLIVLSKTQKQERKQFFAMKQSQINQSKGIKTLNKLVFFGKPRQAIPKQNILKSKSLSSHLINHKLHQRQVQRLNQLEKKGIFLRNPFKLEITKKHDIMQNPEDNFL